MLSQRAPFYLAWGAIHLAIFIYGWWKQSSDQRLAGLNKLQYSVWVSRGAGLCLCLDGFLLFIPVCRNLMHALRSRIGWVVLTDNNIWFHRQVAYTTLFFTAVHTTAHYVNMFHVESTQIRHERAVSIMYTETGPLTGHIMLFIMVLMYTTASFKIRTQCFEAFWYTHHLAFFWAIGLYSHAAGCFVRGALPEHKTQCLGYHSVYVTVWSGLAYFCDRVFREIRGRGKSEISAILIHPSGTVEIRMQKKGFKYVPGQWIFFQMPEISKFQWHPFTISSAPDDPYISIHMRQVGDFTKAVGNRLGATPELMATLNQPSNISPDECGEFHDITTIRSKDLPRIRIDGPYGSPAQDVFNCEVAILIGAGIGVTPFSSILKNIYYMQAQHKLGLLKKVQFIWINKEIASFSWFKTVLKNLEDIQPDFSFLRMDLYLTGSVDEDTISNVVLNSGAHKFDTITGLRSETHFGRPIWQKDVFDPIKKAVNSGGWYKGESGGGTTKVGCFYCGPRPIAKVLEKECLAATDDKVKFEFHKERF